MVHARASNDIRSNVCASNDIVHNDALTSNDIRTDVRTSNDIRMYIVTSALQMALYIHDTYALASNDISTTYYKISMKMFRLLASSKYDEIYIIRFFKMTQLAEYILTEDESCHKS